jgi:hypothetical protein
MAASGAPVFTHSEDERLAAALVSVVRRDDFAAGRFDGWLERFAALEKQVWAKGSLPDAATLHAAQNARNLLRSFYVLLALPQPPPTPAQAAVRDKVLVQLQQIRR